MARGERYAKIFATLFRNRETRRLPHHAFRVYIGAFTHDACHLSGIYELDLDSLFHWASVDQGEGREAMANLVPRFLDYCEHHSLLWIRGKAKRELTGSPKLVAGIQNEVRQLPGCRLVDLFVVKYPDLGLADIARPGSELCIPYAYGIDNQTKPHQTRTTIHAAPIPHEGWPPKAPATPAHDPGTFPGEGNDQDTPPPERPARAAPALQGRKARKKTPPDPRIREFLDYASTMHLAEFKSPLVITRGKHGARVRDWLKAGFALEDLKAAWLLYVDLPTTDDLVAWIQNGRNLNAFGAVLMGLLERLGDKPSRVADRGVSGPWVCEHRFSYIDDDPDCDACIYRRARRADELTLQGKLVVS